VSAWIGDEDFDSQGALDLFSFFVILGCFVILAAVGLLTAGPG
jgi:hypothetical protein